MKILVSGATGNVGREVLKHLEIEDVEIFAGVRKLNKTESQAGNRVQYCQLDFEKGIFPEMRFDSVFLMRPPQLANPQLFERFLKTLSPSTRVVFLSVHGADSKSYLPHAKIEKVILRLGIKHVFVRPCYFMENLLTTLWDELARNQRIYLPSANLKFNWISVADIAKVSALSLLQETGPDQIAVCSSEIYGFEQVIKRINDICGTHLIYESPTVFSYVRYCRQQGKDYPYIFVMLLLHFFPRFTKQQQTGSNDFQQLTGRKPTSLGEFIVHNKDIFRAVRRSM